MNQLERIKSILHSIKPALVKKYHLSSIGLFGSIVRKDYSAKSDIDIIVDFTEPVGIEFIDLAEELESELQSKVDLVSKNGIKKKYFELIESQIQYV